MKLSRILLLGAAVAVVGLGVSMQQTEAAVDQLTVDAQILDAVTISCGTDLDFGYLASGQAGTATVDTTGARTGPGALLIAGGTIQAGSCDVTGTNGVNIDVSGTPGTITNGTDNLTVNNFTFDDPVGAPGGGPYTTLATGAAVAIAVGADLVVAGTESTGAYTGTVDITANYQ